ncbi:MAG: hypothetical protein ACR2NK_00430 [Mariniblastus sp.]
MTRSILRSASRDADMDVALETCGLSKAEADQSMDAEIELRPIALGLTEVF